MYLIRPEDILMDKLAHSGVCDTPLHGQLGKMRILSAPVLRQIARYLPYHRSENASKTHPKSSHDKFETASHIV